MTGTWFLIGTAIGLAAAAIVKGIPVFRRHYTRNLRQYETQIPTWVNQGNRAVIGQYEEILALIHEAAHIELWEREFPNHKDRDDPSYCETCGGACQVDPS